MEKVKRWHITLIICVLVLTLYNILPTLIYYCKPLSRPLSSKDASLIAHQIEKRSSEIQTESLAWLKAFNKQLGLKPKSISQDGLDSKSLEIEFDTDEDALLFKRYVAQAGPLIPFSGSQLYLNSTASPHPRKVVLQKTLGQKTENYFSENMTFIPIKSHDLPSEEYRSLVKNRLLWAVEKLILNTQESLIVEALSKGYHDELAPSLVSMAENLCSYEDFFGEKSPILHQFLKTFAAETKTSLDPSQILLQSFDQGLAKNQIAMENKETEAWQLKKLNEDSLKLKRARQIVQKHRNDFNQPNDSVTREDILEQLSAYANLQKIDLFDSHPLLGSLSINWSDNKVFFNLRPEVQEILESSASHPQQQELLKQQIIQSIAKLTYDSPEEIHPSGHSYELSLTQLQEAEGLLTLDLAPLAKNEIQDLLGHLKQYWNRKSIDLKDEVFALHDYATYQKADSLSQKFGLVFFAPVADSSECPKGFNNQSLYIIAKGIPELLEKYQYSADSTLSQQFYDDFQQLKELLQANGFHFSYLATGSQYPQEFQGTLIFEKTHFYQDFLATTQENFRVIGDGKVAVLELSDLAQRLHTINKLDTKKHEDLLKWKEDYQAAQVDMHRPHARFLVPPPTKNVLWQNFLLSAKKYFRGDATKALKWGLDLSGGKSILLGLKDQNNQPISEKEDLLQAVDELTQRVNKMGLAEVDIRCEGEHISLDFPSSKGLSAQELIKGSSMSFHVVNEQFSSPQSAHYPALQKFLQSIWDEASLSRKTDVEHLNTLAWKHLGGVEGQSDFTPHTPHAKELYDAGLRFLSPKERKSTHIVDSQYSKIVPYSGQDYSSWRGQTHPLTVVLNNFALEGSQIENIRTSYDPREGNLLAFNVKSNASDSAHQKINPRDNLFAWTSLYAKDRVVGTPLEKWTPSRGWRLAIVLNDRIINDPQLNQALRDNVQVSGGFTQQEAARLASDLKAGSLTFKPEILSENNVSADLGQKERLQGISATLIALTLVVALMIAYYRFSGLVASVAVLVNLLIIWAVLQNLQATLSLSGIAGIILTLGMAVDANVLVFERIREEMHKGKTLSHAISQGYKHAFSAIFDSNVTTVLAALILLSFDTGPIKGLAITLTIGITSSMFTALFMTQVFFNHWITRTKAQSLSMANWFKLKSFDFLRYAKGISMSFAAVILIGCTLFAIQQKSIFGMDFTGGYSLNVSLEKTSKESLRENVQKALLHAGAKSTDFQIRELDGAKSLRIQLSSAMEEKGRPFHLLPTENELKNPRFAWQKNPRIEWIVLALKQQGLNLDSNSLPHLDSNWSEMSGHLSKTTRNQAVLGLSLAFFFILIYLSIRFEFRFALSALVCIFHDVLISLALLALLHAFGVPIQMNMQVIAALMTIIGYSLNDTIIVFDRIREELKLKRGSSFSTIINHSLSVTLNRTLMTSLTTFVVLLSLLLLGGQKIFDFSLMMSLGVVVGTLSSLFVAPLVLYFLETKEPQKKAKAHVFG